MVIQRHPCRLSMGKCCRVIGYVPRIPFHGERGILQNVERMNISESVSLGRWSRWLCNRQRRDNGASFLSPMAPEIRLCQSVSLPLALTIPMESWNGNIARLQLDITTIPPWYLSMLILSRLRLGWEGCSWRADYDTTPRKSVLLGMIWLPPLGSPFWGVDGARIYFLCLHLRLSHRRIPANQAAIALFHCWRIPLTPETRPRIHHALASPNFAEINPWILRGCTEDPLKGLVSPPSVNSAGRIAQATVALA